MISEKISVIVPIYGVEKYLDKCIGSICSQTYRNLEIILVDDGSKDSCPIICDKWSEKDNRIVVIHKKNGGLVSARKAGIIAATGKYVTYVDGDDWIEPNMYEHMTQYEGDIVIAGLTKDTSVSCNQVINAIKSGVYTREKLLDLKKKVICMDPFYTMGIYPNLVNKLFIREKLVPYQMKVDEGISIGEDFVVTFPYLLDSKKVVVIEDTSYHYIMNPNGMTGSRDKKYLEKSAKLLAFIAKYIYGIDEEIDRQLGFYTAHILLNGIGITLDIRTKDTFRKKKMTIYDVVHEPFVQLLLKNCDFKSVDRIHREVLKNALDEKYLKSVFYVHLSLILSKIKWKTS